MGKLIFIILLVLIVLISGCVEKPMEEPQPKEAPPEPKETEKLEVEEKISPSLKLLSWQKEAGIRILHAVSSSTIYRDDQYWMYYTGKGGIILARSSDGLNFQDYGPVITPGPLGSDQEMVTNPAVFQLKNGKYRMIYEGSKDGQAIRKLYSAVSDGGLKWTKESDVRLEDTIFFSDPKKGKSGDITFTSVPDVIRLEDDCLRMYYTVLDESRIAISCDEGLTWRKEGKIKFDIRLETILDPDIIRLEDGTYKLFVSTEDFHRTKQWIVSASSRDGVNFKLDPGKRIEPSPGETHVVDPDVVRLPDGTYRMYYGEASFPDQDFDILSAVSQD